MSIPGMSARLGARTFRDEILAWQADPLTTSERRAWLTLRTDALEQGFDYAAKCQVFLDGQPEPKAMFTGIVWSSTPTGEQTLIELRTNTQLFKEQRMGGLAIGGGAPVPEIIASLLRLAGVPDDQMIIEGLSMPVRGPFVVGVPVLGLRLSESIKIHAVTFHTAGGPIEAAIDDLDGVQGLKDEWHRGPAWATAQVRASSLNEAEDLGWSAVQKALNWLLLTHRFSYSITPDGAVAPYQRDPHGIGRAHLGQAVHVRALNTPHRWLRARESTFQEASITSREIGVKPVNVTDSDFWNAVGEWRTAVMTDDPREAVSALWRGIEFFARNATLPSMFSRSERDEALKRASQGLSPEQHERLKAVLGGVNNAPLMTRLRARLGEYKIPIEHDEFDLLAQTRQLRNDLEHGRVASATEASTIRQSVAFFGRMLVYRAKSD
jgi:hypothetical protein